MKRETRQPLSCFVIVTRTCAMMVKWLLQWFSLLNVRTIKSYHEVIEWAKPVSIYTFNISDERSTTMLDTIWSIYEGGVEKKEKMKTVYICDLWGLKGGLWSMAEVHQDERLYEWKWMERDSPCPTGHLSNIMWLREQYLYPDTFNILDEILVPVTVWFIDMRRSLTEWRSWIIHLSYQCSDLSGGLRRIIRPPQEDVGERESEVRDFDFVQWGRYEDQRKRLLHIFMDRMHWSSCRFSKIVLDLSVLH